MRQVTNKQDRMNYENRKVKRRDKARIFTEELFQQIIEDVSLGNSLSKISKKLNFCVASFYMFIYRARAAGAEHAVIYDQAKREQAHSLADRVLDLVEQTTKGDLAPSNALAAMKGLQWVASKVNPDTYGDQTLNKHVHTFDISADKLEQGRQRLIRMREEVKTIEA